ncbi:hypothetical protein HK405_012437 [Cladochytrium tenue]|nr:hypothetical protein HK405_012437 [Cladochytrium tenue]
MTKTTSPTSLPTLQTVAALPAPASLCIPRSSSSAVAATSITTPSSTAGVATYAAVSQTSTAAFSSSAAAIDTTTSTTSQASSAAAAYGSAAGSVTSSAGGASLSSSIAAASAATSSAAAPSASYGASPSPSPSSTDSATASYAAASSASRAFSSSSVAAPSDSETGSSPAETSTTSAAPGSGSASGSGSVSSSPSATAATSGHSGATYGASSVPSTTESAATSSLSNAASASTPVSSGASSYGPGSSNELSASTTMSSTESATLNSSSAATTSSEASASSETVGSSSSATGSSSEATSASVSPVTYGVSVSSSSLTASTESSASSASASSDTYSGSSPTTNSASTTETISSSVSSSEVASTSSIYSSSASETGSGTESTAASSTSATSDTTESVSTSATSTTATESTSASESESSSTITSDSSSASASASTSTSSSTTASSASASATATSSPITCGGAFLGLQITSDASAYLENVWVWTADHELDLSDHSQVSIYTGRGMLVESNTADGGVWMYGTAVEHNQLYNYQLSGARNVFMGLIQTETPYYQSAPAATTPFTPGLAGSSWNDPTFSDCTTSACEKSWGLRVVDSSDVLVYGAGLYSFFDNYTQTCIPSNSCQDSVVSIENSSDVSLFAVTTIGTANLLKLDGALAAPAANNTDVYGSTFVMFSQESSSGSTSTTSSSSATNTASATSTASSVSTSSSATASSASASATPTSSTIACGGAFLGLQITSDASAYLENVWVWTADHELDFSDHSQVSIYTGRGMLVESSTADGGVWMYGTAVEHNQLYNYQLSGARNVFMGLIQTETPYYQSAPAATTPFTPGLAGSSWNDPTFSDCTTSACEKSWGLRVVDSSDVLVYGAGLYSFFDNYTQTCIASNSCQDSVVSIENSSDISLFAVTTIGTANLLKLDGSLAAPAADNTDVYGSTFAVFSQESLSGSTSATASSSASSTVSATSASSTSESSSASTGSSTTSTSASALPTSSGCGSFDPSAYTCTDGMLCPIGTGACGTAASFSCYDPSLYHCVGGQLEQGAASSSSSSSSSTTASSTSAESSTASASASSTVSSSSASASATASTIACGGAFLGLQITSDASAYLENVWVWTADHELDLSDHSQVSIYTGRGMLVESNTADGGVWMYGTAVEHNQLYNYQLSGARNVFMGLIQTETPYYQSAPEATTPFTPGLAGSSWNDPTFSDCTTSACEKSWGLRVVDSSDVLVYGAGLYSFFDNYTQTCIASNSCQDSVVSIENSSDVSLFAVTTIGTANLLKLDGALAAPAADNTDVYGSTFAMFSQESLSGSATASASSSATASASSTSESSSASTGSSTTSTSASALPTSSGCGSFDPSAYTCTDGMLCPIGTGACGTAASFSCYDPSLYHCVGGQLEQGAASSSSSSSSSSSTTASSTSAESSTASASASSTVSSSSASASATASTIACGGAFLGLQITSDASAYLENVWVWTADHELDLSDHSQVSIYTGRGMLVESNTADGGVWMYGTAVEHNQLYNYQLSGARNVFMGLIQTETPYYQSAPAATTPFTPGLAGSSWNDPTFSDCTTSACEKSWGLRVVDSSDVLVYGAGLYSFFDNYTQTCIASNSCQDSVVSIENSSDVSLFAVTTIGTANLLKLDGALAAPAADNTDVYGSTFAMFSQ